MTDRDPTRLIHSADAPTELVQALRLAKTQAPTAASVDAIARGVLAGMGFPGPGGGSPPAGPGTGGGAPPGTTTVTTGAQAALVKGGAVVAAAVVAVGAVILIDSSRETSPPVETPASAVVVETPPPAATSIAARQEEPAPSASEAPKAPPPPPPSETALLDAAQRALGSDPAAALRHCAEHAKHYPGGALSQEREVIAIDALMRLGRTADAKARADRFRTQHPGSSHLRRIDVLVGNDSR